MNQLPELFKYFVGVLGTSYFLCWTVAWAIFERLNTETVAPGKKAVLVTGCDTGFGHDLARRLDQFGFTVFAAVLFPEGEGAKTLARNCSNRLKVVRMDVTKEAEVQEVVKQVEATKLPLWAVVNNAGIGLGAPFDWGHDVDEYRKVFEVNVFGLVRVTKQLMPLLRKTKGSRVVNVASVAGRVAAPTMAHYCMAKHSVRVFSDVLRRELNHRKTEIPSENVSVVVIEPIFYKTPIANVETIARQRANAFERTEEHIKAAYSEEFRRNLDTSAADRIGKLMRDNVGEVVDALEAAVTLVSPKLYYRCCGYGHVLTTFAASHLPEALLDWFIARRSSF
ncbi:hypothetical protein TYRP_013975 [Tyrophagus putrescentiae]|nr:hypothetical protein TYRP_013975 [Tyrophagus putrescentiae]